MTDCCCTVSDVHQATRSAAAGTNSTCVVAVVVVVSTIGLHSICADPGAGGGETPAGPVALGSPHWATSVRRPGVEPGNASRRNSGLVRSIVAQARGQVKPRRTAGPD